MSAKPLGGREVWLVAGSQQLYGDEVIATVDANAREVAGSLDALASIPVRVVARPVVTSSEAIRRLCLDANADDSCVGVVAWMHTFSPAKMWIAGLRSAAEAAPPSAHAVQPRAALVRDRHGFHEPEPVGPRRPRVRLHRDAHAPRSQDGRRALAGAGRSEPARRVVARGLRLARCAALQVARFGDNMREVAVTEGDKVEAQIRFGFSVERLRRRRSRAARRRGRGRATSSAARRIRRQLRARRRAARRRRRGTSRCASRANRAGPARVPRRTAASRRFTDTFEDLHGLRSCPASRPSA